MSAEPLAADSTLPDLARRLDQALLAAGAGTVLVYGSPPPDGRDLDLVAAPAQAALLRHTLAAWGFVARRHRWARFRDGTVQLVELTPLDAWGLDPTAAAALFARARPLDGHRRLVLPSPGDQLLIAARRLASTGGRLSERSRSRVQQAIAQDPDAWQRAAQDAPTWAAGPALDLLRAAIDDPTAPVSARRAAMARAARLRASGGLARLAGAAVEPGDAAVVALSGLDGAGKSTLTGMLQQVLSAAGLPVAVEWTPGHDPSIGLPEPVKQVAFRLFAGKSRGRPAAQDKGQADGATDGDEAADAPQRLSGDQVLGAQKAGTRQVVATAVAVLGAVGMHRATAGHRARGRLVLCDRYVLDNAVKLRYRYRLPGRLALQIGLLAALSPRTRHAFLLEIPGEVAHARKPQAYSAAQLCEQEALYREEAGHLGVVRLDGRRPATELCDEIAARIWQAWR